MDVDNSTTDYGTDNDNNGNWVIKENRKKRRLSARASPANARQGSGENSQSADQRRSYSNVTASAATASQRERPKQIRVIGRASLPISSDSAIEGLLKLKSAKPYIRKRVFGIYNVEYSETEESIQCFIEQSCGKGVLTCFKINTGSSQRRSDSNVTASAPAAIQRVTSTAFRVCIDAKISDSFLNPDTWPDGIVIRPWKFKPKVKNAETDQPINAANVNDENGGD